MLAMLELVKLVSSLRVNFPNFLFKIFKKAIRHQKLIMWFIFDFFCFELDLDVIDVSIKNVILFVSFSHLLEFLHKTNLKFIFLV